MSGKRLLGSIRLRNLLSYGSPGAELRLEPLNVLIGTNASGKSNLIEALGLLAATPRDLLAPVREGGGVSEWIWKGTGPQAPAEIEATILHPPQRTMALRYRLDFTVVASRLEVVDEVIENERPTQAGKRKPYFFYSFQAGHPAINVRAQADKPLGVESGQYRALKREDVSPDQSILSQRKDADLYPELTYVGTRFSQIRLFREWNLGRYTAPRLPQKADLPEDFLLEDASNLGLVLNDLQNRPDTWRFLLDRLRIFYERVESITTKVQGGTVQLFLHEEGLKAPVPATRLSDGTLRYLCLLTILCHPSPPPLVCIDEPELGLHPDVLPALAELLIDASQRTQLIVTTHSDSLVSALSSTPESVVVCERAESGTTLQRLEPEKLEAWLERYKLGELWRMGELGGTRW